MLAHDTEVGAVLLIAFQASVAARFLGERHSALPWDRAVSLVTKAPALIVGRRATMYDMSKTFTIRLGRAESDALARRAKTLGKTRSAVVRQLLVDALVQRPLAIKSGHLKGRLAIARRPRVSWRQELKARNWRS